MRILAAYLAGLVFGIGIAISGMANPAKVLNFFDFAGSWDPSLAFVMGGALAVTMLGYRLVLARPRPVYEASFATPTQRALTARLIGGSAIFGIGWGIAGFCPGGALPVLASGNVGVLIFGAALVVGILVTRLAERGLARTQQA